MATDATTHESSAAGATAEKAAPYRAHYIPNSHLDREWTLDFQHSRRLTVNFIDNLLGIMDRVGEYQFLMDSQTVPLEDYLEVRPQERARLEQFVRAGRLHIGPWYCAPDMNTISGESVTRNLLVGHVMAERFGNVMKVGYTPFGFVHISQLPQIYAGFGIDTCLFYRGINPVVAPRSEFVWEGPDGTRALASRMSKQPRYNWFMNVWRKGLYHDQEARLDRRYDWRDGQLPFRVADEGTRFEHGTVLEPRRALSPDVVRSELADLFEREKNTFRTHELAFLHGFDTSAPELLEDEVLRMAQEALVEGQELFYSSLPRYIDDLKRALEGVELPVVSGEMKHPDRFDNGFLQSYVNIVSTRPRQKQRTARAESLLTRTAEPFAAMADALGSAWPSEYLDLAWRTFLKTHAHDTVGGCCIDRIEEDVNYHLAQTESIAKFVMQDSLGAIQSRIDVSGFASDDILLTMFNPSPFPRDEVVTCYVDIPRELGIEAFGIVDAKGEPVPFTARGTGNHGKVYRDPNDLAMFSDSDEYEVRVDARGLPALGYETFAVRRGAPSKPDGSLVTAERVMENEYLEVKIGGNGSLDVLNKKTGRQFAGLHVFEDMGEAGHPWMHLDVKRDVRVTSEDANAEVELVEDTALCARYRVALTMTIPATSSYGPERNKFIGGEDSWRDAPDTPLRIESIVTLTKDARAVDVETAVDNASRNHRLRVLFPARLETDHVDAEIAYDVIERPIPRDERHPQVGMPHIGQTFLRFVDAHDGKDGIAFTGVGIREYEAFDDADRTIAVTLFRAVEDWLCTTSVWDRMPGDMMQVFGTTTFHYRIVPHAGGWDAGVVHEEAEKLNHPVVPCLAGVGKGGELPTRHAFCEIEGAGILLSCVKKAERSGATVVRVFNPGAKAATGSLRLGMPVASVEACDMNEQATGETIALADGRIPLTLPPKKVQTVLVTFKGSEG